MHTFTSIVLCMKKEEVKVDRRWQEEDTKIQNPLWQLHVLLKYKF